MNKNIAIIGAGGHSKVIIDLILEINKYNIIGIYDDNEHINLYDIPFLGKINSINIDNKEIDCYVIAIGNDKIRKKIYDNNKDLIWETLIHPKSIVSKKAFIGEGTVICAGAIIQTEVIIGKQCIINTNCNIDHESRIGDFTSICPGVTICGNVKIGYLTFIGANSVIIQNIQIGNECLIGAGSVIIKNFINNSKVVGNPGRLIN